MVVKTLFFTFLIALGCLSIGTVANSNDETMEAGKEFANTVNDSSVKGIAKDMDPSGVPNYQGTDIPETDYYESGVNIENQAHAVAADNPTAQFLRDSREKRPDIQLDRDTDPLFTRYNEIKDQAHNLTNTYSDCEALPVGVENNITVDERPTASCEPGSVHTEGNTSCLCERTVVDTQPLTPECPSDYSFDSEAENCTSSNIESSDPDLVCEAGYHLNANTQCEHSETLSERASIECPANYIYSTAAGKCTREVTDIKQPVPTCVSGYRYDAATQQCLSSRIETSDPQRQCAAGYSLNANAQCQHSETLSEGASIECPANYVYSIAAGQCIREVTDVKQPVPTCVSGYRYDAATQQCLSSRIETSDPQRQCAAGYSLNSSNVCEKSETHTESATANCAAGYSYIASSEQCVREVVNSAQPSLTCASGYTYVSQRNQCEKQEITTVAATPSCPSGYTYDAYHNRCQTSVVDTVGATVSCSAGQLINGNCVESIENCRADLRATRECKYNWGNQNYFVLQKTKFFLKYYYYKWGQSHFNALGTSAFSDQLIVSNYLYYRGDPADFTHGNFYKICRCALNQTITTTPSTSCPTDYSLNSSSGLCEKVGTIYQDPGQTCPAGYSYNSSSNLCEKQNTLTLSPILVCDSPYQLNQSTRLCEHTSTANQSPQYSCPSGYSLRGRLCEKTVVSTQNPQLICAGGQALNPSTQRCEQEITLTQSPTPVCDSPYQLNQSTQQCEHEQTFTEPPEFVCPSGYSLQGQLCQKTVITTNAPQLVCGGGQTLNRSTQRCEQEITLTQSPTPVCDSPYHLNQSTQQCKHEQTFTEPPEFVCSSGYSLQGQSCQKTVVTTADPEKVCAPDETLNPTTSICEKTVVTTAAPTYFCEEGYVLNPATNECEEEVFSFSCETTTPARTVELCGQTLMCPEGNCAEEYQQKQDASQDFLKAATGIAVASEIAADIDQENLTIFEGDSKQCKKKLAGFSNCCKDGGWGTDLGLDNCSTEEKELGLLKEAQRVQYVGRYCSDDSFFGCLAKNSVYCTYPSKLARIVIQQGKAQLNQGFGTATSPNCAGFSVEELESLNFDAMDLSEFYSDVAARDPSTPDSTDLTNDIQEKLRARYEGIQ